MHLSKVLTPLIGSFCFIIFMLDLFEIIGSLNIVNNWHYARIYPDRHRELVIARNEAIHYGATRKSTRILSDTIRALQAACTEQIASCLAMAVLLCLRNIS